MQKQPVTTLERFGADPGTRDASRVLRLVDTINTRSGERVRVLWVNESQGEIRHYGFDHLAEWMLPVDRDIIRKERKAGEYSGLHIPTQIGHPFRSKPATVSEVKSATHSDPNRPWFPK